MRVFKKVIAVILCFAFLISFAACGDKNGGETSSTTESTTENKQNDKDVANKENGDGDDLLITFYPEQNSKEYQELTGEIKLIETVFFYGADAPSFRFVAPRDGVKVKLEAVRWSPIVSDFEPYDMDFEITTEKNKIYKPFSTNFNSEKSYRSCLSHRSAQRKIQRIFRYSDIQSRCAIKCYS